MPTLIRRRARMQALVVLVIVVGFIWYVITIFGTRVPVAGPYVDVVTTRCLGPDGRPVGEEYGQPCPSGTTQDTVVIQTFLPTTHP